MSKDIDEQIIYWYRNGFSAKGIAEKTGLKLNTVKWRLQEIRKKQKLLRWWAETPEGV
jgi:DNA-directed RNA polymerase specialized sigma24 family protein